MKGRLTTLHCTDYQSRKFLPQTFHFVRFLINLEHVVCVLYVVVVVVVGGQRRERGREGQAEGDISFGC